MRLRRDDLEQPDLPRAVSGSFKNALGWLILLAKREPPYLPNKPIGLITTAGRVQGLQAAAKGRQTAIDTHASS